MNRTIFLLSFLTLFVGCTKQAINSDPATPEDLLVQPGEISGWTLDGNRWTAASSGELNTYINGEEVVYTRHGFVEASMQEYQGTVLGSPASIELRIFDQGSQANANALYDELELDLINPQPWTGAGEECAIERFPASQRLLFWQDKYFVSISISSGLDEALTVLKTFAGNVSGKIG